MAVEKKARITQRFFDNRYKMLDDKNPQLPHGTVAMNARFLILLKIWGFPANFEVNWQSMKPKGFLLFSRFKGEMQSTSAPLTMKVQAQVQGTRLVRQEFILQAPILQ